MYILFQRIQFPMHHKHKTRAFLKVLHQLCPQCNIEEYVYFIHNPSQFFSTIWVNVCGNCAFIDSDEHMLSGR